MNVRLSLSRKNHFKIVAGPSSNPILCTTTTSCRRSPRCCRVKTASVTRVVDSFVSLLTHRFIFRPTP